VNIRSRDEDIPGPEMVMIPGQLPLLSKGEEKRIIEKIYSLDTDMDSESAVYEDVVHVLLCHILC
jgi:hypothetical protein